MLLNNLMKAAAADDKLMVEDVFSAYTYTGTGSTSTITTGIDLSGDNAGMIWLKSRPAATDHAIYDTVRGATYDLASNLTTAQTTQATGVTGFGATGFSMGALAKINTSAATYAAWTFKKAPKFFDVVQFTASSTSQRVNHSLGVAPGMIILKCTTVGGIDWHVYHRALGRDYRMKLNSAAVQSIEYNIWGTSDPTSTDFGVNTPFLFSPGDTVIAYLWAHDDSEDGVVQCGSFSTDASGNATVNLGWEPQYVIIKSSSTTASWYILDTMRGWSQSTDPILNAHSSFEETTGFDLGFPHATGFNILNSIGASRDFIYLAIRRGPMRVPTDGTKVYNAIARTGTGAAATVTGVGFAPDVVISKARFNSTKMGMFDRLRGKETRLCTSETNAEAADTNSVVGFDVMDGLSYGTDGSSGTVNYSGWQYVQHLFRRAPGFFDQVCYTGTGVARTIAHGLKSVPGMIWVKCRSYAGPWHVYHSALATNEELWVNDALTAGGIGTSITLWANTRPTTSEFSVAGSSSINTNGRTYTAYLFGDTAGLCKAFSYTGNGSNQDIALGFAPRFVLLKRTDSTGDWKVFDSTRGIVSGNDPVLALNSTAAEVTTTDPIDPIATGFNIAQEATNNLNVNAATYIGWAAA